MKIGMASIDENGKISGGKAGDQTGKEVLIRDWYSKPWDVIIRAKDPVKAGIMANAMICACKNENIGYDQYNREDLLTKVKAVADDFSKITTKTETDCSALVATIIAASGTPESAMRNPARGNKLAYTGDLEQLCRATGEFEFLTDSKYLTSGDYLKAGDILLNRSKHAAMAIEDGPKVASSSAPSSALKKGSKGDAVKILQSNLNKIIGAGLAVDGSFGAKTEEAVKLFQKKYGLVVDGSYGPKTDAKMKELINQSSTIKTGIVTAHSGLNVRNKPNGTVVTVLAFGAPVSILSESNGWIKIAEGQYVSSAYIKK